MTKVRRVFDFNVTGVVIRFPLIDTVEALFINAAALDAGSWLDGPDRDEFHRDAPWTILTGVG
jgi:hypothetical protein